jgi:hypothetical protein
MIGIRGLVPLLLMLMSSFVLKVLLSAGTMLSGSSGLYLGTCLSFGLLFLVSSEFMITSASSPLILFVSSVTKKMNPMITCFSVMVFSLMESYQALASSESLYILTFFYC